MVLPAPKLRLWSCQAYAGELHPGEIFQQPLAEAAEMLLRHWKEYPAKGKETGNGGPAIPRSTQSRSKHDYSEGGTGDVIVALMWPGQVHRGMTIRTQATGPRTAWRKLEAPQSASEMFHERRRR
jgi:hypothetical protein